MTKYYADVNGNYLGGFDGADSPVSAVEVPKPPAHGWDKWVNGAWVPNKDRLNATIKVQIVALETQQHRAIREAVLSGDKTRLLALEDQIKLLRAQLKP